jgi:hypothetical protein
LLGVGLLIVCVCSVQARKEGSKQKPSRCSHVNSKTPACGTQAGLAGETPALQTLTLALCRWERGVVFMSPLRD